MYPLGFPDFTLHLMHRTLDAKNHSSTALLTINLQEFPHDQATNNLQNPHYFYTIYPAFHCSKKEIPFAKDFYSFSNNTHHTVEEQKKRKRTTAVIIPSKLINLNTYMFIN